MASTKQITLYTAQYSPYAHRVRLALNEAKAKYTTYEFNAQGKPEWYYLVNPLGKIPAITYGGPDVPPDQPSPSSAKLVESLALIEFIADIYPEAALMPVDPVLRAEARAFISLYENYVHSPFRAAFFLGQSADIILEAIGKLQRALPPTGFAVSEWSIADIAVAPFLTRMMLFLRTGLGAYTQEDGQRMRDELGSDKFARFRQYISDIHERSSFKNDWNDEEQIELWKNHPNLQKHKAASAS